MSFTLSPGVSISEVDFTTIVPAVSTTAGGFAGFFRWGPVNTTTLQSSEITLAGTYQPPDGNTAAFYWSAANFLAYGNNLNVVRAGGDGMLNATATANTLTQVIVENEDDYFTNFYEGSANLYGPWMARYPGQLGNSLVISTCPSVAAFSANLTSDSGITAVANVGQPWFTTSASIAANTIVGDLVRVGLGVQSNGFVTVTGISGLQINTSAGLVRSNGTNLTINRKWQFADQFSSAPGTSTFAASKSGMNDELHVVVVDANGVFGAATTRNYILEKYSFLSKALDAKNADSSPNFFPLVLFNQSKYVYWADNLNGTSNWGQAAQGVTFDGPLQPSTIALSGGSDLTTPYSYTNLVNGFSDPNDGGLITAYSEFANSDDIDISLIPTGPASVAVQQYVIDNIVTTRLDCVTFVSPRYSDVVNQTGSEATNIVENYLPTLSRDSSYVVADCGWKYQFDKYSGIYRYIPLNADIAGLCVNTDMVADPWYSPAGFNRGNIKNVAKLAWNPSNLQGGSALNGGTSAFRDLLYVNGVNSVVSFKGTGTVLFGDKTLQAKPSAFDRIGVRRLFITLEKAIATAAKYSLFEFNDAFTQAAFVNMVVPYLRTIKGRRGLYDYKVVCDSTNNTPDIIDAEQFVGDIFLKPSRSVNWIQLNFTAVGTGVDFNEVIGATP